MVQLSCSLCKKLDYVSSRHFRTRLVLDATDREMQKSAIIDGMSPVLQSLRASSIKAAVKKPRDKLYRD